MSNGRLTANGVAAFPLLDHACFGYDRDAQATGIVHFGIGAFHRAHQAWYTDLAMEHGDRNWRIAGISLRSGDVAEQMNPQDGVYTVSERGSKGTQIRVIGAVREVLVAAAQSARISHILAAPDTHIASFTITEKGYCRAADGTLDPAGAGSVYALLAAGLSRRRDAGRGGITLLSCDNIAGNGAQLRRLMREYLELHDPGLTDWFEGECTCPSTMVDRIVPATTEADRAALEAITGWRDEAAVMTEPFSQWVIEDSFAGPRPHWEVGGAQFTRDVRPFEAAKLRMLNGAHSALAYLGLGRGHDYVDQAIADPTLAPVTTEVMREAAASLTPAQDLAAYADALLARFGNAALAHRLRQIAMDGSQKIPQRWLETLAFHQRQGRPCAGILTALAAWIGFVGREGLRLDDPMAGTLHRLWQANGRGGIVPALFGAWGLFAPYWTAGETDITFLDAALTEKP